MKAYFYILATGLFTGKSTDDLRNAERNTPDGCGLKLGAIDHLSQRVEVLIDQRLRRYRSLDRGLPDIKRAIVGKLEVASVVDYIPPQPNNEHEWNADTKRWQLTAEASARNVADAQARGEIARLEAQQARPMRELALDRDNLEALQRLDGLEIRIAELRAKLKR